jgi:hypothetical protein
MTADQLRNLINSYEQDRVNTRELLAMYRHANNERMCDKMYEQLAQISTGIGFYTAQLRNKEVA